MPAKPRSFLASPDGVNRINAAKARLNLTITALAEQAGVSTDTVGRLLHPERGKRVSATSIAAIAEVLELLPEYLVPEEEWQDESLAEAEPRIHGADRNNSSELVEMVNTVKIFISYCRQKDSTIAQIFAHTLRSTGFDVFIDTKILVGDTWARKIHEALNSADYFLLLFSEATFKSRFVEMEIKNAINLSTERGGIPVIWPVRICLPSNHYEGRYPWGFVYDLQHEFWQTEEDNPRILESFINKIKSAGEPQKASKAQDITGATKKNTSYSFSLPINTFKLDGAALSIDSPVYITRNADKEVLDGMQQRRALIHIKGARQTGKTSLIIRQYKAIEELRINLRTILIDFQALPKPMLESLNVLWYTIAEQISSTLEIDNWDELWKGERTYNINFTKFLSDHVFKTHKTPILICFDGVDHVFNTPIREGFFSSVRSFYNQGAHHVIWGNVRWLLSTSTEPTFFIKDLTQSPFNVGSRVDLSFFEPKEVQGLINKYGLSLDEEFIAKIIKYLGGHPYLTHLMVNHLARSMDLPTRLFEAETAGYGLFQDHLNRYLQQFQQEETLFRAMQRVINGYGCDDVKVVNQLEGAGLVKRNISQQVVPMCELYEIFFRRELCK